MCAQLKFDSAAFEETDKIQLDHGQVLVSGVGSDEIHVSSMLNTVRTTELFKTMSNKKNLSLFTEVNIPSSGTCEKIKCPGLNMIYLCSFITFYVRMELSIVIKVNVDLTHC